MGHYTFRLGTTKSLVGVVVCLLTGFMFIIGALLAHGALLNVLVFGPLCLFVGGYMLRLEIVVRRSRAAVPAAEAGPSAEPDSAAQPSSGDCAEGYDRIE